MILLKIFTYTLLLIKTINCTITPVHGPEVTTILTYDLISITNDIWQNINDPKWRMIYIKEGIEPGKHIYDTILDLNATIDNVINKSNEAVKKSKLILEPIWLWAQIEQQLVTIDGLYKTMKKMNDTNDETKYIEFASAVLSKVQPGSIQTSLDKLHELSVKENNGGIFRKLPVTLEESGNDVCSLNQSPQQLIYNLYNLVAATELKGYAMMQFSWMILHQYGKGNFSEEAELMKERTEERSTEKAEAARSAMVKANKSYWRCDPKVHEVNKTYIEVTELLQGQLQNEVDLNQYGTCRENCGYYTYAKTYGCYNGQHCQKQRQCNGRLFNCQFIDSDSWVCPSEKPGRRYDWVEFENGRVLGRKTEECSNSNGASKIDSWWRWLFWHCSYCLCICDEQGPKSDRYFSLRQVISAINSNKVIVGIRFVKIQRVIHLQIQEAIVKARGVIDEDTIRWKPVDSFRVENAAVGVDYHVMTYEQRALDLDDLIAPEGYVLTGIRFRRIGTHLNLEILTSPFDFVNGKLNYEGSIWTGNDNTDAAITHPRTQVNIRSPDIPTRSTLSNEPKSETDQFVTFTHTDINKDAAQTTVPFIDSQPVIPSPPILLSGAGIFYKGQSGYGGYIAIKVFTYDYSNHLGLHTITNNTLDTDYEIKPNIV